jgi:glutaminyl-tRNA synthetase
MGENETKREAEKDSREEAGPEAKDFIRAVVDEDLRTNKWGGRVATRFPPEPNGYLHIGHAKSICLNFGIARQYGGVCHLRFDDTNPIKEDLEYIESIKEDVQWLGFDWGEHEYYASDYFDQFHDHAVQLIKAGRAYVDDLTPEQIREYRGTLIEPGRESPYRSRTVEENLDLFRRMRDGEFEEGTRVLRAKIDMSSPNVNLRDPTMYRIKKASHHRTGERWCIYPMYDFAHCLSDSIERITHSICTLEFENNRPLYDWFLDELGVSWHPQQIEFARLNLSFTVMSKRKLLQLVREGYVNGWDDPRMPTISGLRRRGYTPEAIRGFCDAIGIAKRDSVVDIALLEYHLREDLNRRVQRRMAVLRPVTLIIDNYLNGQGEELDAENNPEEPESGVRKIPFSRELYIEESDFREDPPAKWFRLAPGREVRLKHAYYVTCTGVKRDPATGKISEIHCTYDPATRGGWSEDGRKVKGTLHWVSASHAKDVEIRLYDHLFTRENPDEGEGGEDFKGNINPDSLQVLNACKVEPSLGSAEAGERFQFLRLGYFCVDPDSSPGRLVFNRTVSLRDTWAKIERAQQRGERE